MPALYSHTTRATGTTLSAAIYNADHENHITNGVPAQLDDYSSSVAQMQSVADPGELASESQATSLAGEIERLRFAIKEMKGVAQWYITAPGTLSGNQTINTVSGNTTLTSADIGKIHNITDTAAVTLPASGDLEVGDVIRFKSSTTKAVTLEVQGSDTIDTLTQYRIPAYTNCEVMKSGVNTYIMTSKPDDDVGMVKEHAGTTAPLGWSLCDNNTLSRTDYGNLFAVVSTTFGVGDGATTFGKPNHQRRAAIGTGGTGTGTVGNALGNTGGEETHTLTAAESGLPEHAHTASGTVNTEHVDGQGDGNTVMESTSNTADGTVPVAVTVNNVAAAAASSAHNIMQPVIVMNFIVKL